MTAKDLVFFSQMEFHHQTGRGSDLCCHDGAMVIYFRLIIGPLLLAFILAYLLQPLADRLSNVRGLSWRLSVNVIYLASSSSWPALHPHRTGRRPGNPEPGEHRSGFPGRAAGLLEEWLPHLKIGPFTIDLSAYLNLNTIGDQVINNLQGLVGRAGSVLGSLASGAAARRLGFFSFDCFLFYPC